MNGSKSCLIAFAPISIILLQKSLIMARKELIKASDIFIYEGIDGHESSGLGA